MKKLYYIICGNYRKFENPNIIHLRILVLSVICNKFTNEDEKIFKEEESTEILKILGLITLKIWVKNLD